MCGTGRAHTLTDNNKYRWKNWGIFSNSEIAKPARILICVCMQNGHSGQIQPVPWNDL